MSTVIKDTDLMFRIHLDKIRRWLKKIESFYTVRPANDFDELLDTFEVFCIYCYQLKDYLIKSILFDETKVYDFVRSNPELQMCADLCNKTKHMTLREFWIDPNISIEGMYVGSLCQSPKPHLYLDWQVAVLNKKINPLQLAKRCLALWESFITSCGENASPID